MKTLCLEEMEKFNGGSCGRDAAMAGLSTLGSSIAAGVGAALFTGGISIVVGVVGGAFGSVAAWGITYAGCRR